ncbi:DUF4281 domain-containing protein [candidate division KSB1 bacterium]|nr:DUF4281 domain-containing protein [candidate division KSB1 bacterium]NIR73336.1 DUF4281 domain-containing protein [candidate division KSB1 bacterium]NIS27042.1 DUF4281 domain-containing protein [candidate division KSB1 bacterium]NIT73882.1 DUF4281 domain-containing protein [candidate division KSB1 bacterium]NIU27787.1 DUF4281 domain-containing protein [candidate division KSB1 bacterium]
MYVTLFSLTAVAMLAWLMLVLLPRWRFTRKIADIEIFPVYLAVLYVVGIVPLLWETGLGVIQDFGSAEGVTQLLSRQNVALIAWIHILTFDQVVGFLIYRDNMKNRHVSIPVQSIILVLTLTFGPVGYLCYYVLRLFSRSRAKSKDDSVSENAAPSVSDQRQNEGQPISSLSAAVQQLTAQFAKERTLFLSGVTGIAIGLIGLVVMFVHGPIIGPEGVLRKAVSFDIAVGIYVLTILLFLPLSGFSEDGLRRWRGWHVTLTYLAYAIENIQIARGLDPRFSRHGSPADNMFGGIFFLIAMGLVVLFLILALSIFRERTGTKDTPLLLATRYAFACTIFAFAAGLWMSFAGGSTFGSSASILPLHAIGFHGLQAVPIIALFQRWSGVSINEAKRWVHMAGSMWLAACIAIAGQTVLGRTMLEVSWLPALTLALLAGWSLIVVRVASAWFKFTKLANVRRTVVA